jgi:hypothetical protein
MLLIHEMSFCIDIEPHDRMQKVKKHLLKLTIFLLGPLFWGSSCFAELVSNLDASLGYTTLNVTAGSSSTTISGLSAVEVKYILNHTALSMAYLMCFDELLRSQDQSLPYTQFSAGVQYFPMGFNGSRMILDQNVTARVWKATPFLGLTLGLANISTDQYNASMIEISPRGGVELPMSSEVILSAQLVLRTASAAGSSTGVSYNGISALLGLVYLGL